MSFPVSLVGGIPGQFLECSFRGIPFAVTKGSGENGRKVAVHEYPYKDGVWVEDVGKKGRRFSISGFMLGALGYTQRDLLSRACELPGPGLLVHPSLGAIYATCTSGLKWSEREGVFNVVDLEMEFIEQTNLFSIVQTTSAHAAIGALSASTALISSNGYISAISPLAGGSDAVVQGASQTAANWSGPLIAYSKTPTVTAQATDAQSLSDFRDDLTAASQNMANAQSISDNAQSMSEVPQAVLASNFSSENKIKMLLKLCDVENISPLTSIGDDFMTISQKKENAEQATSCLSAFLSIGPLCEAISDWQPDNSLEALEMISTIRPIFDQCVLIAPSDWEGLVETIFKLRSQTVKYLYDEIAQLPDMIEIEAPSNLPSFALAQILYGDGTRFSEIENQNPTIHPAFMPKKLKVKSQ